MLKREFRWKYPCNPLEGKYSVDMNNVNHGIADPNSEKFNAKYYDTNKPNRSDLIKAYCKTYNYDFDVFMADFRSIKRINPRTKKFYKSKKYQ